MKKTIKLAVVAALALGATSAFATNGSTMLGMGAKTRGMGGIGIGMGHGAESALSNPALITTIKKENEISFGGTIFMPDVENTNGLNLGGFGDESSTATSEADMFMIPSVSVASKINDNFYAGVGMWGTGGLGVDYRDAANTGQMHMVTALQLMQFGVPLVYTSNNFALGVTPILQYGSLDINYVMSAALQQAMAGMVIAGIQDKNVGVGVADDLSFGYNIGLSYETNGLTLGAVYISEIEMDYDNVMSTAMGPMTSGTYTNNKLSSPAQYGLGVSYKMNEHTIALDWKNINWSDASGYEDFSWEDQDVISIGYEFATNAYALRVGYAFADSAVQDNANASTLQGSANLGNTFNQLGFPGTIESHFTFGGTYNISEMVSVDLAAVIAAENTMTTTNFLGQQVSSKHSETSYSFQLNYAF